MPEPLLYLKAVGASAIASGLFVLAMARLRHGAGVHAMQAISVGAMGLGLIAGYMVLLWPLTWPPVNGLDRFLTIVLPAGLVIELIAGLRRIPQRVVWGLRLILAVTIPRALWHGSVYLDGDADVWTVWQAGTAWVIASSLLASVWLLLSRLPAGASSVSLPIAVCLATLCSGLSVMMAGYLKGGAAAFPLAATLLATTLASWWFARYGAPRKVDDLPEDMGTPWAPVRFSAAAILGIGVVGLFGLLFIGRFFGRLSTGSAVAMMGAPLLCWATEIPPLRGRPAWVIGSLRVVLVALMLAVVLFFAKRTFDRDMAPLLGQTQAAGCATSQRCQTWRVGS